MNELIIAIAIVWAICGWHTFGAIYAMCIGKYGEPKDRTDHLTNLAMAFSLAMTGPFGIPVAYKDTDHWKYGRLYPWQGTKWKE